MQAIQHEQVVVVSLLSWVLKLCECLGTRCVASVCDGLVYGENKSLW